MLEQNAALAKIIQLRRYKDVFCILDILAGNHADNQNESCGKTVRNLRKKTWRGIGKDLELCKMQELRNRG